MIVILKLDGVKNRTYELSRTRIVLIPVYYVVNSVCATSVTATTADNITDRSDISIDFLTWGLRRFIRRDSESNSP